MAARRECPIAQRGRGGSASDRFCRFYRRSLARKDPRRERLGDFEVGRRRDLQIGGRAFDDLHPPAASLYQVGVVGRGPSLAHRAIVRLDQRFASERLRRLRLPQPVPRDRRRGYASA
jgi:hypothetical protein